MKKQKHKLNELDVLEALNEQDSRDFVSDLKYILTKKDDQISYLQNKVTELSDDLVKDKQVKKLNEQINKLNKFLSMSFIVTDVEWDEINKWQEKHIKEKHKGKIHTGAANESAFSYIFTPTSLGNVCYVKCNCCDEQFEFSDL